MKRKIALILVLCLSLGVFMVGCGGSDSDVEDNSWIDIQDKGYFVVGLDDAFPPMGFRETGTNEIVGFDIDLAKEAAERLGVEVKFQPVVWESAIEELNGHKVDVIWNGLTITESRKKQFAFTAPYIEDKQLIVVQNGSQITNKADLEGKTVGIQAGSSAIEAVQKDAETYESIGEMVEFGGNDEALLDLAAGRLDAVVVDEVVGRYYMSKKPGEYDILTEHFGLEEFGVGLRLTDQAFLAELDKVLSEMKADGAAAEISNEWFGEDITK
ncbi:MAG TPA: amino acid ABC transporter substrate-binding protein [Syntrophomonadaceae bacterium]|nr:amino acid ABC transporter substrate-binding protein [Syntrophomonadaceae bacterium]